MSTLRVAIVDDESLARDRLQRLFEEVAGETVQVVLQCVDADELIERAASVELDVLFLDIEMPGGNAFDILQRWQGPQPDVVLVTAYDAYAVRAFDASVIDYLLKPVSAERLRQSVTRLLNRRFPPGLTSDDVVDERIPLQIGQRTHLVALGDIEAVVAQGNYVEIHTPAHSYLARRTLASFERQLDAREFLRVHRSVIVRTRALKEIRPIGFGRFRLETSSGRRFETGRSHAWRIRDLIK
jgi:two-component system, LytTR family, response regulator